MRFRERITIAALTGVLAGVVSIAAVNADTIQLENGDEVTGKVLEINDLQVVFESELLGRITVARDKVARVQFGSTTTPRPPVRREAAGNRPAAEQAPAKSGQLSDASLIKELRARGLKIESLEQLHDVMPEISLPRDPNQSPEQVLRRLRREGIDRAALENVQGMVPLIAVPGVRSYFESTVGGLISGRLGLHDLRQDAIKARDGLRDIQKDLGPNGDALDGYLKILEGFLEQTEKSTTVTPETTPNAT